MKKITLFALLGIILQLLTINTSSQWIEWRKTIYSPPYADAFSIKATSDGNFIVCGETNFGGRVIKINPLGDTLWISTTAGGYSIMEMNGFYYCVYYSSIYKLDVNGNRLWGKEILHNDSTINMYNISQTSDNKILICGESYLGFNGVIGKIDTNGNVLWTKRMRNYTGVSYRNIKQTIDGNIIAAGLYYNSGNNQFFLEKFDNNGNSIWNDNYGAINHNELAYSVFQTYDEGFLMFGFIAYSQTWNTKIYIVKTDKFGNFSWSKIHGDSNNIYNNFSGDFVTKSRFQNQYVITGMHYYHDPFEIGDCFISVFDSVGNSLWERLDHNDSVQYFGKGIAQGFDSTYVICGNGFDPPFFDSEPQYFYFLKTHKINPIGISSISSEIPGRFILHQNYPNPFNPVTKIKFELPKSSVFELNVYDILGRKVYSAYYNKPAGTYEIDFDGSGFASGIYFYSVKAGEYYDTKKMIILK